MFTQINLAIKAMKLQHLASVIGSRFCVIFWKPGSYVHV